jgi:hypothetical protein
LRPAKMIDFAGPTSSRASTAEASAGDSRTRHAWLRRIRKTNMSRPTQRLD